MNECNFLIQKQRKYFAPQIIHLFRILALCFNSRFAEIDVCSIDQRSFLSIAGPIWTGRATIILVSCCLVCYSWLTISFVAGTFGNKGAKNFHLQLGGTWPEPSGGQWLQYALHCIFGLECVLDGFTGEFYKICWSLPWKLGLYLNLTVPPIPGHHWAELKMITSWK